MRINTKLIMMASAFLLALTGLALTFLPGEIVSYSNSPFSTTPQILFQILGALYFAFAMLNWMAKGSAIGGIYNRPIAIANFTHFFIGGLALIKLIGQSVSISIAIPILGGAYAFFAVLFGLMLYTNPVRSQQA